MADNKFIHDNGCKEAVCVDAGRVYDSCSDKDCIEDMRVYFTERDQMVVDHAASIRARRAEVITTYIDVEALPFNRGYYSCDLTFFFEVEIEVYAGHGMPCSTVCGVGMFQKKVILYGSEGNVRVFSSEFRDNSCDPQDMPGRNAPRCTVPGGGSRHPERPPHRALRPLQVRMLLRLLLQYPGMHLQPVRRRVLRR